MNILDYLESVCEKYPCKTAVSMLDRKVTFEELRSISGKLASVLIKECGNAAASPIGVFANRSVDTVSLFIAVLYSGNFYVPLDPDLPVQKLQSILEDAQISVILGDEVNREKLTCLQFHGQFMTLHDAGAATCPIPAIQEGDPLYMVYTSGSTGRPKGVLKSHGAMISFLEAYCKTFLFSENEVIGNQTPFFFDASAKDLYLMLKTGATLEIIPTGFFSFPPTLIEYLNERKITVISWVPTALSIVAQLNTFTMMKPTFLKKVFFVGEVMPLKYLKKWKDALPEIQYVNLYGQSELAGICCYYEVPDELDTLTAIPIGKPLDNCQVCLYDKERNRIVTEPEQIGELYVASPALASGYYHDIEKTKACFLECDLEGGKTRIFKTGDLAQYSGDGNLVFAARDDLQIKHMGHRIEPGEIEKIADALPGISRSCCLYKKEKRRIVLFCEAETGTDIQEVWLRKALRERLSDYMMPAKVHLMEHLPMNANGKIDRYALQQLL